MFSVVQLVLHNLALTYVCMNCVHVYVFVRMSFPKEEQKRNVLRFCRVSVYCVYVCACVRRPFLGEMSDNAHYLTQ